METKIENLQNQIDSLHEKIIQLESNLEDALREPYWPKNSTSTAKLDTTTLNQKNEDFISPSQISEEERVEIIKKGFQLNQEGKISLKKYYEGTETHSLYQWKGYSIKYDSIRKTNSYKRTKDLSKV